MKGTKVGSYIIGDQIGEGGMGIVYSATHSRMNRKAVVKVLRKQLADSPEMARRFENEANAAASIGHPGIVQVFDIGQQEDGSLYIVMELLVGESLQERLHRLGRLPVEQAVMLMSQAADALAAAHALGIVHRDLKPDNIFIVPDSLVAGGERAKLLDFGIAKLAGDGVATMMTKTGAMMGTPHYMSPEQCQGASGVDHASDLYSLGCILFQLVSGRTPFVGTGVGDFIVAHMTQPPPLLRSLAADAPQELEEIVSNLLAKSPTERFASASALAAALRGIDLGRSRTGIQATVIGQESVQRTTDASEAAQAALPSLGNPDRGAEPATTLGLSAGEQSVVESEAEQDDGSSDFFLETGGARSRSVIVGLIATVVVGVAGYSVLSGDSREKRSATEPIVIAGDAQLEMVRLTFRLDPPAAEVFVGGKLMEETSNDLIDVQESGVVAERSIDLPKGQETMLEVRAPGYDTHKASLSANADQTVEVTLFASEQAAKALRVKERKVAWQNDLVIRDTRANRWKATLSIDQEVSALNAKFTPNDGGLHSLSCSVVFGEDGNLKRLRGCASIRTEPACQSERRQVPDTDLVCAKGEEAVDCSARLRLGDCDPSDGEWRAQWIRFSFRRPLIEADKSLD